MILPNKHVTLSRSLLNVGAILLNNIADDQTITLLWSKSRHCQEIGTFDKFTLGLDLLFMIGLIAYNDRGLIRKIKL